MHAVAIVEALVQLFQDFEAHEQDPTRVAVNPNPLREALSRKGLDFKMGASVYTMLCRSVAALVDVSGPGLQSLSHRQWLVLQDRVLRMTRDVLSQVVSRIRWVPAFRLPRSRIRRRVQEPAGSADDG